MENVIVIILIGKNDVFKYGENVCPLHYHSDEYMAYIRATTKLYPIIVAKKIYDGLPSKSPPFSCRTACIIGSDSIIEPNLPHTRTAPSFEEALLSFGDEEKIVVLADLELSDELIKHHEEKIDLFIKIILNEEVAGTDVFQHSLLMNWFPSLKAGEILNEKSSAAKFTILELHRRTDDFMI